jgi:hypothetical protein
MQPAPACDADARDLHDASSVLSQSSARPDGRIECLDGATYQAEPADLAAIMPKTAKKSKLAE